MTHCEDIQVQLNDFADGNLSPSAHEAVQRHLESCAACAGVLADLERITEAATLLGPIAPPAHVWTAVSARLNMPASGDGSIGRRQRGAWLSLAAAALLLVAGGVAWKIQTAERAPTAPAAASVESVNHELTLALQHYERAMAQLEEVTSAGHDQIDPSTAAVVRENMLAIDRAIAESRAALASHPENDAARASLFAALEDKISVLQAEVRVIHDGQPPQSGGPTTRSGRES